MKRSTAMILTIVSIVLCGCPGLAVCVGAVETPALIASLVAQGTLPATNLPASIMVSRLVLGVVALVLIAIPVIIGLVFLRKPKGAPRPAPVTPGHPQMVQGPARTSTPAPVSPAWQPTIVPVSKPAAQPAPVYEPPAPAYVPEPPAPVYVPPAPAPEPEPLPPVYEPPAPAPEPEPPAPVYEPPAPMYEPPAPVYVPPAPAPEPIPPAPVYEPPAPEPEPVPPVYEAPAPEAPEAPVTPPADQPGETAQQVFATAETPFPPMMEEATRLASNWCLVFVSGPSPVNTIQLAKKVSLGRSSENDVVVADPLISRQHAIVESIGGGYQVTDLSSANGTFINDAPVTAPARLRVGDLVKFGGTVFRFQPSYGMQ